MTDFVHEVVYIAYVYFILRACGRVCLGVCVIYCVIYCVVCVCCGTSKEGTTQGDPLAMAMYVFGTKPLIECLNGIANQVWYADDSAAGSTVANIRRWWDVLVEIGPLYGHYPNSSKTHILTKPEHVESVTNAFKDTDITVSTNGKGYLGGAIGSTPFVKLFMEKKIEGWIDEIKVLSKIANSQPMPHLCMAFTLSGITCYESLIYRMSISE